MSVDIKVAPDDKLQLVQTYFTDNSPSSDFFNITELPDTLSGGKNAFLIAGSDKLFPQSEVKVQVRDAAGNVCYVEYANGNPEYYEGISKVVAVYVYPNETAFGPATITILGQAIDVPDEWKFRFNVKWQTTININPSLPNTTRVRFYKRPKVDIVETLEPIYRIESGSKVASGIIASFANIKISELETFAGDVKRVKVFRTSEGDISDFDLIQDILIESKELLTTFDITSSVKGNAGIFTNETLKLWNSGSLISVLTNDRLDNGLRLSGSGIFKYNSPLSFVTKSTYELNLDAFYSSSTNSNLGVYISGSNNGIQLIGTLEGTIPVKNLEDTYFTFDVDKNEPTASLYLSQSQSEWHVANISLKLSEDSAFSPNQIDFITTMPTIIGNETFNFKFEFYDVNNNFIPVAVTQSANFIGGSNTITKLLTFESDRTAFRFSTGSFANPPNQSVRFKTIRTNFTGSVTYASAAFDVGGNYIEPSSYAGTYPGTFVSQNDNGALLNISSFSGSVSSILVGSITYTASCEGFQEFETIYRFEDGENAPGVFVTANTNQFIYKATDLSLNPTGQIITIEAKRKNLGSASTPLTINSASAKPPLTLVSTNLTNGVDTYTIAGSAYPFLSGSTTYSISGSDQFGNQFSDAVTITPVKILDGFSIAASNENTSLPANSAGSVIGGFVASSGSITVKVGNEVISYASPIANNKFSASISATSGLTANTFNGTNYSINALSADSGSLTLLVKYQDGGGTIISSSKDITYSKVKKAAPVLAISSTPKDQSVTAKSTGEQIDSFANATIVVKETYNGATTNLTITSLTAASANISSISTTPSTGLVTLNGKTLANGINSTTVDVSAVVTDSEGVSRTLTDTLSLSKVKKAVPNVVVSATPQAQSVLADAAGTQTGTLTNVTVSALEGATSRFTSMTGTYSGFSTNPTISTNILTTTSAVMNAAEASATIVVTHTDSEGTSGQTQTIVVRFTKVPTGTKGDTGDNGDPGADGKRTATGLLYYQLAAATAPPTPTATSYTFSTNTFGGLTTNWALGAPTFAAGNSNKYWYSTYTAVETTAGGNTAVPTFTTVTQAIGFTGLVTFTSANKITDGSNILENIPSGSITNHIGGPNVTTINGGKISTGIITSTGFATTNPDDNQYTLAGTIFNLDNGSLRSKNFFISSSGDAFFKGTVSGSTITGGTLSGTTISGTTISGTTISGGTISGTTITGGTINIGPNKFSVDSSGNSTIAGNLSLNTGGTVSIRGYKFYNGGSCTSPSVFLDPGGDFVFRDFDTAGTILGFIRGYTTITNCGQPGETTSRTIIHSALNGFTWGQYAGGTWATLNGTELNITGDVVANTSDKRLKTNIVNIDSPLEKISKINGVYFNWNETAKELTGKDTEQREVGFIAQEVQSVLPEIVKQAPFDTIEHTNQSKSGEEYLTIQYEKIVPLLVECIKELKNEIEELKKNR
jgi:hypothetical protein